MVPMPLLPDPQIGITDAAPRQHVLAQRRILSTLTLLTGLALAMLAWTAWDGIRADRAQMEALSGRAASLAAVQLAHRLDVREQQVRATLATHHGQIGAALGAADTDPTPILRRWMPELIRASAAVSPADAPALTGGIGLEAADGQPAIVLRARLPGPDARTLALILLLPCAESCAGIDTGSAAGIRLYLAGGGGRWRLNGANPSGGIAAAGAAGPRLHGAATPATTTHLAPPVDAATSPLPRITGWQLEAAPAPDGPAGAVRSRLLVTLVLAALLLAASSVLAVWVRQQTKRAIAEHTRLGTNRRKLAAILDSTTEGIILADAGGAIELFNPAAEVMFGQLGEDVLGANLDVLLPEVMDARLQSDPGGRGALDAPTMCEVQARRGDGGRFPARIWLHHLALDDGPRLLVVAQDLTETAQSAQQLTFLEQRDVLTGLLNRKEFARRMQRHMAEAAGSGTPHVLCYIDIDQFKVINDTAGHAAGDALVEQIATLIAAKFDDAELLARLGGDEFGALFANCSEREALDRCEGLMQTIRNFLFTWRDRSFDVAVSIGVTAFQPDNDSAAAELAKADVACHMAKHDGRDRIHVYRDGDTSVIRHHGNMHLVSTISQALSFGRFRLYSQPILPLGGALDRLHYEVLVRMLDEHGEAIRPDQFIPAAEQYILMPAVDRWIIHQLFSSRAELLRAWHEHYPGQFLFAVNLSGTSVTDDSFLPYLRRQFQVHAVPPASICFEITETAAMRNLDTARAFMSEVAAMGATFALDDFGSGLSSYNYLRELPVSYLKIDGSFVHDMNVNPVNHALVASINQVAHVLGLKTVAEWAEDTSTINQLRALNVDYAQGYAIGVPLPVQELQLDPTGTMTETAPT